VTLRDVFDVVAAWLAGWGRWFVEFYYNACTVPFWDWPLSQLLLAGVAAFFVYRFLKRLGTPLLGWLEKRLGYAGAGAVFLFGILIPISAFLLYAASATNLCGDLVFRH
jgi:hypothetical protein